MGPFFRRFARELSQSGIRVSKINFNGGDAIFYRGPGAVSYRGRMQDWGAYFERFVQEHGVDAIFLFGDCRPIHKDAIRIARARGIAIWVFEEGYLRPDHITLERDGVNGNSTLPKDPEHYREAARRLPEPDPDLPVGHTFLFAAWYATVYACAMSLAWPWYRRYRHHRYLHPLAQTFYWCRGWVRKQWYRVREAGVLERCQTDWADQYYLVPLQVHCDFQIEHSKYERYEEFMEEVVASFAEHAPAGTRLVLKHHPQDRAYRDYTRYFRELGERHGCGDRLVYVHDLHLPTLLKHARGTVTMNSTVGTSSLYHHTPVKVMGRAIYDIPGLTSSASLADFWTDCGTVDQELYAAFNRWLRVANQINGSFYKNTAAKPERALRLRIFGGEDPAAPAAVVTREAG